MCSYLSKRGATYYFRRVIPAELQPALGGKSEFMLSLWTKDREQAKRLIPAHTATSDKLMAEAQARLGQDSPQTAVQRQSARAAAAEQALFEHGLEAAEIDSREASESAERYEAREALRQRLERAFRKSTAEITPDEAAARDLLRAAVYRATLAEEEALALRVERAEERRGVVPREQVAAPAMSTQTAQAAPAEGVMLERIVALWEAERKPARKTRDAYAAVARWFTEREGEVPVASIKRANVLSFKDKLLAAGQTPTNVNVKLDRLRTLLQFAADNDHAAENVAANVRVIDNDLARNRRREFDLAALNRIFAGPVFAAGERPAAGKGEAAYWIPLLALFTGARLEELAQLRPEDVKELTYPDAEGAEQRHWFIQITEDDEEDLKLKNAGSERLVPVHPELERLGFLKFARAAARAKQARLFPLLRRSTYGRLGAKWGEWFSLYLRTVCGVTDRRNTFHSFRHTFKHYARHAGIIEGVQRQIMGHSSGDTAESYGSGYTLHQVVGGMGAYKVPGLALPGGR